MENTARLYHCARCRCQTTICSHCDRGNRYCSRSCADLSRRASLSEAGKRYQDSRRGRAKHAERQRRYRARCQKVTHQGSPTPPPGGQLHPSDARAPRVGKTVHCHFCGRLCSPLVRLDFLHRAPLRQASERSAINRPPLPQGQAP